MNERLKGLSAAGLVEYGYGQVEPNHLSAQRNGQIYAQLPAAATIEKLENGQFVKYDYLNGEVNYSGAGEWMLVYNEIKLYRDGQGDAEFAMLKGNYNARVYSPVDPDTINYDAQTRYYGGKDAEGNPIEQVTAPANIYDDNYNEDPFHIASTTKPKMMKAGTKMVPRVFKTNIGDIFTTNMVAEADVALGAELSPRTADGILSAEGDGSMTWQVVKVYTMPDGQKGVKVMRVR